MTDAHQPLPDSWPAWSVLLRPPPLSTAGVAVCRPVLVRPLVGATTFVRDVQITEETVARLAQLDPREAEVLGIRFGLDRGSSRTLDETAEHFGLRPERVAQIETRAIANLRQTDKPD